MQRLISLYMARHLWRDLAALVLTGIVALAMYFYYARLTDYYWSLDTMRHLVARMWVLACVVYAATSFAGSDSGAASYGRLLLPAPAWQKFTLEAVRCLVVFPLLSMLLLTGIDAGLTAVFTGEHTRAASITLWRVLTYTTLPLYHLPMMPFYAVVFSSLVMLIRSARGARLVLTVVAVVVLVAMIDTWGPHDRGVVAEVYPFLISRAVCYAEGYPVWTEAVSWTGLPEKAALAISYLWYALIPVSALVLAWLNVKSMRLRS